MEDVNSSFKDLQKDPLFTEWKKEHSKSFLSHFFNALDKDFKEKGPWEIGLFDPDKEKITVFVMKDPLGIKSEDEVFKKPQEEVESLDLNEVKISYSKALEKFKENLKEKYPKMVLGDGFVVLQTIKSKTLWNFTFITKTLQFVNIKINSQSGELDSHQTVELVNRG